jgi:hypothetical protein
MIIEFVPPNATFLQLLREINRLLAISLWRRLTARLWELAARRHYLSSSVA